MADDTATQTQDPATVTVEVNEPPAKPEENVPPEVRAALKKANKEAETLRLKLQQFEDAQKTEAQKLAERAEAAEKELNDLRVESLRSRVALAKGLPSDLLEFLTASDEESLTAQADRLLSRLATPAVPGAPRPDSDQGARPGPLALNGDPLVDALNTKLGIR